jgi:hypothetical protein
MAKTSAPELPTLEDFTEKSLLDTAKSAKASAESQEEEEEEEEPEPEKVNPKVKTEKKPVAKTSTKKDVVENQEEEEEEDPKQKVKDKTNAKPTGKPDAKKPGKVEGTEEASEEEEEEEEEEVQESFWSDVEKITGMAVQVEYGEVDPETPEGAALRDQALAQQVMANYAEYLKNKFPRSYRMLEHEANGGSIEDILTPNYVDYSKIELKEENKDQQKKILMDYYKSKGFDDKKATKFIETEEDDGSLFEAAKSALEDQVKTQQANEKKIAEETKQKQLARERQDQQFMDQISKKVNAGKVGQFMIIDKKDKEEFLEYALGNIHRAADGQGYVLALPIQNESIDQVLQQMYFGYKKGELGQFVKREAQSENARRLKRKVEQKETKISGQEDKAAVNRALPTLDIFKAD